MRLSPPAPVNLRIEFGLDLPTFISPRKTEFDVHFEVVVVSLWGVVTVPELAKVFEDQRLRPECRDGLPRLWDVRDADVSQLTRPDFPGIGRTARTLGLSAPGIRVAVVVSRDVDFGVGRMVESTEGETLPAAVLIFREHKAAMSWLKVESNAATTQ